MSFLLIDDISPDHAALPVEFSHYQVALPEVGNGHVILQGEKYLAAIEQTPVLILDVPAVGFTLLSSESEDVLLAQLRTLQELLAPYFQRTPIFGKQPQYELALSALKRWRIKVDIDREAELYQLNLAEHPRSFICCQNLTAMARLFALVAIAESLGIVSIIGGSVLNDVQQPERHDHLN